MKETADRPTRVVLLTLGSNIDPERNMFEALDALDAALGIERVSAIYEAAPVGAPETPRFLNAAVCVLTDRSPSELKFDIIRPLEARLGRIRTGDSNAPRTIDIDIAAFGDLVVRDDDAGLEIPDPGISRWAHLALPLRDVAPTFRHPVEEVSLEEIGRRFDDTPGVRVRADLRWPAPHSHP